MRVTIGEALREMRLPHDTDAGRLKGHSLRYGPATGHRFADLPGQWGERFAAGIAACASGRGCGETPHYVVTSDGLPVAWLTVHAAVIAPDAPMSRNQAKHQRLAAEVLGDLARFSIEELADGRDDHERRVQPSYDQQQRMIGAVRVAPGADATNTRWVRIGGDLDAARDAIGEAVGCHAGEVLIVAGVGYGRHGQYAHRLDLAVLCAMNRVADEHQVPLSVVGDWVEAAAGLAGQPEPDTLPGLFRVAYAGRFDHRSCYTSQRMTEQGWDTVLRDTGMAEFFDEDRYTYHLFAREVFDIARPTHLPGISTLAGVDVFGRRPAPPAPTGEASR
ncbi:MAG: hypothetical protein ACRDT6_19805 [Micromonosporaceae bacterium]